MGVHEMIDPERALQDACLFNHWIEPAWAAIMFVENSWHRAGDDVHNQGMAVGRSVGPVRLNCRPPILRQDGRA